MSDHHPAHPTMNSRQAASLAKTQARFTAVATRFQRVYGLRLPRHMAVFTAFWDSLDRTERTGMGVTGLGGSGITAYFDDGGLDLVGRDGLDERLESRYRLDPPEFVTVMHGDSDGLHFGLWYDDPAHPPAFVAHNWARDDATTLSSGWRTPLGEVHARLEETLEELDSAHGAVHAALRAVEAFADADREAWEEEGYTPPEGTRVPVFGSSMGLLFPPGSGDPSGGTTVEERLRIYRERLPDLHEWMIPCAREELAAGRPAFALVLGHELRFADVDEYREEAWHLLGDAYRALDRQALADIAAVHHAHLDLPSVGVLTSPR